MALCSSLLSEVANLRFTLLPILSRVCMKECLAWSSAKKDAFGFLPPLLTERSEVVAASPPETWSTTSNSCQWNRDNQTSDTVVRRTRQEISDAAHGTDTLDAVRAGAEFLAEIANVHINAAVERLLMSAVDT